jgi:hypothetical protein
VTLWVKTRHAPRFKRCPILLQHQTSVRRACQSAKRKHCGQSNHAVRELRSRCRSSFQGRSDNAIDPHHRGHFLCTQGGRIRRRGQQDVMITFRSPSSPVGYWRKSGNTCLKLGISCCSAKSPLLAQSGHSGHISPFAVSHCTLVVR